jgi:hypothetical protein
MYVHPFDPAIVAAAPTLLCPFCLLWQTPARLGGKSLLGGTRLCLCGQMVILSLVSSSPDGQLLRNCTAYLSAEVSYMESEANDSRKAVPTDNAEDGDNLDETECATRTAGKSKAIPYYP